MINLREGDYLLRSWPLEKLNVNTESLPADLQIVAGIDYEEGSYYEIAQAEIEESNLIVKFTEVTSTGYYGKFHFAVRFTSVIDKTYPKTVIYDDIFIAKSLLVNAEKVPMHNSLVDLETFRIEFDEIIEDLSNNKVDKVEGKELSTNDFTDAYKGKLDGIEENAEVNVNADWDAITGDAEILNKPTTISGYGITDAYTKIEVDEKITNVYKFKGSVNTYADLPTEDLTIGDVYNVLDTGDNYAWTGAEWDDIGGTIALASAVNDGLMSKEDYDKLSNIDITTLIKKENFTILQSDFSVSGDYIDYPHKATVSVIGCLDTFFADIQFLEYSDGILLVTNNDSVDIYLGIEPTEDIDVIMLAVSNSMANISALNIAHTDLTNLNDDTDNVHIKQELKDLLNAYGIQTLRPQVFEIKCNAGRFNCSWNNSSGRMWQFPEGTVLYSDGVTPIRASNDQQPDVIIPSDDSIVKLSSDNWSGTYAFDVKDSGSNIAPSFKNLPKFTNYLSLAYSSNTVGDISDLPPVSRILSLINCVLITGNIQYLPPVSFLLELSYCTLLEGDLQTLPSINYLLKTRNCSLIYGAYTQVNGEVVPTLTDFSNTSISAADMDSTLIAYANCTKSNGTFTANGMTRTSASDTAVATLTGRGWTISGLTTV